MEETVLMWWRHLGWTSGLWDNPGCHQPMSLEFRTFHVLFFWLRASIRCHKSLPPEPTGETSRGFTWLNFPWFDLKAQPISDSFFLPQICLPFPGPALWGHACPFSHMLTLNSPSPSLASPCDSSVGQKRSLLPCAPKLPGQWDLPPVQLHPGSGESTLPNPTNCHVASRETRLWISSSKDGRGATCQQCSHLTKPLPFTRLWSQSADGGWPFSWLLKSMFK